MTRKLQPRALSNSGKTCGKKETDQIFLLSRGIITYKSTSFLLLLRSSFLGTLRR
jgi:hypothetical protein